MKCSFCGKDITKGTGTLYVRTTGKVLYFDTMKCEKNMLKLNRKPRETKWTAEHRGTK
jgi:large subunit ribosomal protein L24e